MGLGRWPRYDWRPKGRKRKCGIIRQSDRQGRPMLLRARCLPRGEEQDVATCQEKETERERVERGASQCADWTEACGKGVTLTAHLTLALGVVLNLECSYADRGVRYEGEEEDGYDTVSFTQAPRRSGEFSTLLLYTDRAALNSIRRAERSLDWSTAGPTAATCFAQRT